MNYLELKKAVASGSILIIDTRNRTDFNSQQGVPNVINVPLHDILNGALDKLNNSDFKTKYGVDKPNRSSEFVISGVHLRRLAKYLKMLGYSKFRIYFGTIDESILERGGVANEDEIFSNGTLSLI